MDRSSAKASNILSRSFPALPTHGRPSRSSSRPGASPINIICPSGLPSANTVLVARRLSSQPSKFSSASFNAARLMHDPASSRAAPGAVDSETALAFAEISPDFRGLGVLWRLGVSDSVGLAGFGAANRSGELSDTASSAPASTSQRSMARLVSLESSDMQQMLAEHGCDAKGI